MNLDDILGEIELDEEINECDFIEVYTHKGMCFVNTEHIMYVTRATESSGTNYKTEIHLSNSGEKQIGKLFSIKSYEEIRDKIVKARS